jgi:hypothetical protein
MNTLEHTSSPAVLKMTDLKIMAMIRATREKRATGPCSLFGVFSPHSV